MTRPSDALWSFLSPHEQVLFDDGLFLLADSRNHLNEEPTDWSYLVFPFAKLYEGFLKDLLLRLDILPERQFRSEHFRVGKVMSPNLIGILGKRSAYLHLRSKYGNELPALLWQAWKEGRNRVFHFFPQYPQTLTKQQAEDAIRLLVRAMETAVAKTKV